MVCVGRANANTSGRAAEHPALELAAAVEAAAAARAAGDDRVVELGRYRLVRTIGRGGMGQVFEAWDTQLERHVALKLVLHGGTQATLDEARCLARLAHPNVVSVHEVGCVDDWGYIAMELVDGPNLRQWLRSDERKRSWREVVEVILSAGRGLAAVHDAGLLHGDVKPGNILIGRDGRVRVADFGLARIDLRLDRIGAALGEAEPAADPIFDAELDELVRRALEAVDAELGASEADFPLALDSLESRDFPETAVAELRSLLACSPRDEAPRVGGTVPYMAPERLAGSVGGPAADQYSLCAAAWEALFGEVPPAGGELRVQSRWLWRRCPPAITTVLRRGLAVDPRDRWPSLDALCSALQRARDGAGRSSKKVRRGLGGLAVAISLATGLFGMTTEDPSAACELAVDEVSASWGPEQRRSLERRFAASDLPLPRTEARFVTERLDTWVRDWTSMWKNACMTDPEVRRCLEHERTRFEAVLALLGSGPPGSSGSDLGRDAATAARTLVTELGSPRGCLDDNRPARLDVAGMGRLAELAKIERRIELAVLAGAYERAADQLASFDAMLDRHAPKVDRAELVIRRLSIEPIRARVLAGLGDASLARDRLRQAIREAEAAGHDGVRFALLLEQSRLASSLSLDDLAVLEGLAERVDADAVARAELTLLRTRVPGAGDHRQLGAALELAEAELGAGHQPDRNAELRFELASRRAELYFEAGDMREASNAAEQAWEIARASLNDPVGSFAALRIAGISAALLGDCDGVWPIVTTLRAIARSHPDIRSTVSNATTVDWTSVRFTCPNAGRDLQEWARLDD